MSYDLRPQYPWLPVSGELAPVDEEDIEASESLLEEMKEYKSHIIDLLTEAHNEIKELKNRIIIAKQALKTGKEKI